MNLGNRIKEERLRCKLSQEEVAKKIGSTKQAVYKYENGIVTNIPMNKIEIMANLFGTTPAYLMGWKDTSNPIRIPVFGEVAAGIPMEAITDIEDWEEISPDMACKGEYAALKIHGDSMEPRMHEGDVVIVRLQNTIEDGDTAIVFVNGDSATCKKIKKTPGGIMLISSNPAYEPMFYSNKQIADLPITIWGKVVELRAKF